MASSGFLYNITISSGYHIYLRSVAMGSGDSHDCFLPNSNTSLIAFREMKIKTLCPVFGVEALAEMFSCSLNLKI